MPKVTQRANREAAPEPPVIVRLELPQETMRGVWGVRARGRWAGG